MTESLIHISMPSAGISAALGCVLTEGEFRPLLGIDFGRPRPTPDGEGIRIDGDWHDRPAVLLAGLDAILKLHTRKEHP